MKTKSQVLKTVMFFVATALAASNCSSMPGQSESSDKLAATGPTIISAHSNPSTIELDKDLQAKQTPEILADVKDFGSKVTDVKLKFRNIPIQVPMKNIGGTTWKANLTQKQLQMMAVSGKTIKYEATVVAKNKNGVTAESPSPLTVAIKAPDLSRYAG